MILLRHEQDSKDLELIRIIKKNVTWFLQMGPQGTDSFFYHHQERTFHRDQLKVKIKSLKIYLDTTLALITEDCVDSVFVENTMYICQCAILGAIHLNKQEEKYVPKVVQSTWVYILMWVAKDIINNQSDNRSMKNAVKSIELKILAIMEKLCYYRLNL